MNYQEARELSEGQQYAFAMPSEALPTPRPVPEQEAIISCFAPVRPTIDRSYIQHADSNHVRVNLSYMVRSDAECIMERPDCKNCRIYDIAQGLTSGMVTLTNEDFENGNLEAYTPQI